MSVRAIVHEELDRLGAGTIALFDVHAHTGADIDGTTRSCEEHVRALEALVAALLRAAGSGTMAEAEALLGTIPLGSQVAIEEDAGVGFPRNLTAVALMLADRSEEAIELATVTIDARRSGA